MNMHLKAWLFNDHALVNVYALIDLHGEDKTTNNVLYRNDIGAGLIVNQGCKFDECELLQSIGRTDMQGNELFAKDVIVSHAISAMNDTCGVYVICVSDVCDVFVKDFLTGKAIAASMISDDVWLHDVKRLGCSYQLNRQDLLFLCKNQMEAKKK